MTGTWWSPGTEEGFTTLVGAWASACPGPGPWAWASRDSLYDGRHWGLGRLWGHVFEACSAQGPSGRLEQGLLGPGPIRLERFSPGWALGTGEDSTVQTALVAHQRQTSSKATTRTH